MVSSTATSSLLKRLIEPDNGNLPTQVAEFLESLDFEDADHARVAALAQAAQRGRLTQAERQEYETYVLLDDLLAILRLKARRSRQAPGSPAKEPTRRGA